MRAATVFLGVQRVERHRAPLERARAAEAGDEGLDGVDLARVGIVVGLACDDQPAAAAAALSAAAAAVPDAVGKGAGNGGEVLLALALVAHGGADGLAVDGDGHASERTRGDEGFERAGECVGVEAREYAREGDVAGDGLDGEGASEGGLMHAGEARDGAVAVVSAERSHEGGRQERR